MDEVVDQLQWRSSSPAAMEEVVHQLQWKKVVHQLQWKKAEVTSCYGRSSSLACRLAAAMEVDQLKW